MQRLTITNKSVSYIISPEDRIPLGRRIQVIVRGRVIDDITKQPLAVPVTIKTDEPFSRPIVTKDGIFGLMAVPWNIFLWLSAHNYAITMTLSAAGYVPVSFSAMVAHDVRTITGQDPVPSTRFTLNNTQKLSPGNTLVIGNPGPHLRSVLILSVDTGTNQVMVKPELGRPELLRSYVNEPAVPVVPDDFKSQDIGDISLVPI